MKDTEQIEKLHNIIIELLDAGEGMTDAAETCGHDEALEDWQSVSKKAIKAFPNYKERKAEIDAQIAKKRKELHEKKEKDFIKEQRTEDAKILAEFGLGLSADGKVVGL